MSIPNKRPIIPTAIVAEGMSVEEQFQNKVLRPIIKAQHELLIAIFIDFLKIKRVDIKILNYNNQKLKIKSVFTSDIYFKNEVKGMVIGQFSPQEYQEYTTMKSQINKKIWSIQCQRVMDSLSEIMKKLG